MTDLSPHGSTPFADTMEPALQELVLLVDRLIAGCSPCRAGGAAGRRPRLVGMTGSASGRDPGPSVPQSDGSRCTVVSTAIRLGHRRTRGQDQCNCNDTP